MCNDIPEFFDKIPKIKTKREEEFDLFVNVCEVDELLHITNLSNTYNDEFRSKLRVSFARFEPFLTTQRNDIDQIFKSLNTPQRHIDQFIFGCICFVYHNLTHEIRCSLKNKASVYNINIKYYSAFYHHIDYLGPSKTMNHG